MSRQNVKPRFESHKLEGELPRRIAKPNVQLDKKGEPILNKDGQSILLGGFTYEDVMVDAGWNVYFPNGASIHVWTKEAMQEYGFLSRPSMIDMETGDEVEPPDNMSLKSRSEQKERVTKTSAAHHTL